MKIESVSGQEFELKGSMGCLTRDDHDEHGVGGGPRVLGGLDDDTHRDGQHEDGVERAHVAGHRDLSVGFAPET